MSARRLAIPVVAALAFAALALLWLAADRSSGERAFPPFSARSDAPTGTSLARRYLAERGSSVRLLGRALSLDSMPADGVVFRLGPTYQPLLSGMEEIAEQEEAESREEKTGKPAEKTGEPAEKQGASEKEKSKQKKAAEERKVADRRERVAMLTRGEQQWVSAGGRLVLAIADSYGPLNVRDGGAEVRRTLPLWPAVRRLAPSEERGFAWLPVGAVTVWLAGRQPLVGRLPLGKGEVILIAAPEMFANRNLGRADHLALLEALAGAERRGRWGEARRIHSAREGRAAALPFPVTRPVAFDEYVHGLRTEYGLMPLLGEWGFGPALATAALAMALFFWRGARRTGPPERDPLDTRSEAVDLVGALGELYDRALGYGAALRLYEESLSRAAAARTGLRGSELAARVRELLRGSVLPRAKAREDIPAASCRIHLASLNEAFRRLYEHHSRNR